MSDAQTATIEAMDFGLPRQEHDGWRPIETAPREGTEFVMLDVDSRTATVGKWMADVEWMNVGARPGQAIMTPRWFPLACPTHWMPLPAPPLTGKDLQHEQRNIRRTLQG